MTCPKCQFDNLENAKFCSECGNKLEFKCPECRKMNPIGSKFCSECGHDLRKSKDRKSVDYEQPQTYTPRHLAEKILTMRSAIKGERKHESTESKEGYKRVERSHGVFMRRFSLPDGVDGENISASSSDGVLEVVIPKSEPEKPRRIEVR